MSVIYTVTTCSFKEDDKGYLQLIRDRCVGFYNELADAMKCVENNWGDIYEEGYYSHAVIERLQSGLYQHPEFTIWFKWDKEKEAYVPFIGTPEGFECVTNYGIG